MRACLRFRRSVLALALLLLVGSGAGAQQRRLPAVVLGLGAGYDVAAGERINEGTDERIYDQNAAIRTAEVRLIFPKIFMAGWGLTAALQYGDFNLSAVGSGSSTVYVGGAPTTGSSTLNYDLLMRLALVELMTHVHLGSVARLEVGPFGGIGFLPDYVERERVTAPAGATLANGAIERADSTSPNDEGAYIAGLGMRLGYEIPIVGGLAIMPTVNLRALAAIDGDGSGIAIGGSAGLGLMLLSGTTEDVPFEPLPVGRVDTVLITDSIASTPRLRAHVDLYSVDSTGRRADTLVIAMRRTLRRVEVPLETAVHFEHASAALTSAVVRTTLEATRFTEDDLIALSPVDIRRRSLEVIASRMRADESVRLTLKGTRGIDERAWFAEARARSVRTYLQNIWGIDSARVTIARAKRASSHGRALVTIETGSRETLAPVVTEWIEQQIDAPPIGVQPTIVAAEGVHRWRVSVMQGEREIGVVRNTDSAGSRQLDIGLALREVPRDEAARALGAELVVEDSAGGVGIARDRMEVLVNAVPGSSGRASADSFLGEFLIPTNDDEETSGIIEHIVETLPANARVSVSSPRIEDARAVAVRMRAVASSRGRVIAALESATLSDDDRADTMVLVRVEAAID